MQSRRGFRARRTAVMVVAAVVLAACSSGGNGNGSGNGTGNGGGSGPMQVGSNGESNFDPAVLDTRLEAMPTAELTTAETAGLLRMREEEKLAHDVYSTLYDQWQLQAFDNISSSELTHTDAVLTLLDRYDLADPAAGNAVGEFTNADLQSLYTSLVERGSSSLVDALEVGATIEDLDISDLRSLATDTPDLALVYANLEKGSRNHLRAFTKQLAKNGADYTPAYISQADYDAIIASDMERGSSG